MNKHIPLFSSHAYQCHHNRAQSAFENHQFLFSHVANELLSRLKTASLSPKKILNLSPHPLAIPSVEAPLPTDSLAFSNDSFDLIISCLQAHWVDNLPNLLSHIERCLKPGGLFLGALWGGKTLHELRESFLQAEMALTGGASPRVAPMLQPLHAPLLLGKAGLHNPVTDTETLTVMYESTKDVMRDLRGMGETNALQERKKTFSPRGLFDKMETLYKTQFGDEIGQIPATFEVIYLTGWKAPLKG